MRVIIFEVGVEFPDEISDEVIEDTLTRLEDVVLSSGYDLYESTWSAE